jgi:hypothetical protein
VTPSRLRSPHMPIARTGSGGPGRPGTGAVGLAGSRANPLLGVGVTLTQQHQVLFAPRHEGDALQAVLCTLLQGVSSSSYG